MAVNVVLKYNPFTVKTDLKISNQLIESSEESDLFDVFNNKRLSDYIDTFLDKLHDTYRETEYNILFEGTALDAEDLKKAVESNKNDETLFNIDTHKAKDVTPEDKIKDLKTLFEKAKKGPFEELRGETMETRFNDALDPNFEVNVIATMSSGKSTVINAMLGTELMPAKNEACTATIAKVYDCDGMEHFEARRFDDKRDQIDDWQRTNNGLLTQWNDDEETSFIDIRGDIPAISEKEGVRIVFVDTPGPNNSNNIDHRRVTTSAITGKPLSMILYILNATQLSTNDDQGLLGLVRDAMAKGGRKAQDRFVFIINKIDEFDPEKGESVKSAIDKTKKYLRDNGIENPLVVPASAELAKLIRLHNNIDDNPMTRKQKGTLNNLTELFVEETEMNLVEHVKPFINKGIYDRLQDRLAVAQSDHQKAEILSGIPIVEELFENFLKKHALPSKIKDAVDSFSQLIAEAEIIEKHKRLLEKGKDEQKRIIEALVNFENNKERIEKAKEFREKTKAIKYKKSPCFLEKEKEVALKFEKSMDRYRENFEDDLEPEIAKRTIRNAQRDFDRTFSDIQTILYQGMDESFYGQLDRLRDDYQKYVAALIDKEFPSDADVDLLELQQSSMKMPDIKTLLSKNSKDVRVKIGTHEEPDRVFYNPFTWFRTRTVTDYDYIEKIAMNEIWNEIAIKLQDGMKKKLIESEKIDKKNLEKAKDLLLDAMAEIDTKVGENLRSLEKASQDRDQNEKQLNEIKKKLVWFYEFKKDLKIILSV